MDSPYPNNPHPVQEEPVVVEEEKEEEDDEEHDEEEEGSFSDDASPGPPAPGPQPSRRPFTALSQVDADLALARTLQEQERAYLMLRMGGDNGASESGSEYEYEDGDGADHLVGEHGSMEGSEYDEEEDEDAFDAQEHGVEIDPAAYPDDEAYARALQEVEEREVAVRLMALAGINDWVTEEREDRGSISQEMWQDVDPDEFSYEELVALGEAVGTESRGLSTNMIASLPSVSYEAKTGEDEQDDQCVICRLDYEDGDSLSILPCKHLYHSDCINKWLQINKVCPVCSAEVSIEAAQG